MHGAYYFKDSKTVIAGQYLVVVEADPVLDVEDAVRRAHRHPEEIPVIVTSHPLPATAYAVGNDAVLLKLGGPFRPGHRHGAGPANASLPTFAQQNR